MTKDAGRAAGETARAPYDARGVTPTEQEIAHLDAAARMIHGLEHGPLTDEEHGEFSEAFYGAMHDTPPRDDEGGDGLG